MFPWANYEPRGREFESLWARQFFIGRDVMTIDSKDKGVTPAASTRSATDRKLLKALLRKASASSRSMACEFRSPAACFGCDREGQLLL